MIAPLLLVLTPTPAQDPDSSAAAHMVAPIEASIAEGTIRGAVLVVGRGDEVVHRSAHGMRAEDEAMTLDTVFDCASLTKTIATTSAVLALVQDGRLSLGDRVVEHVPSFAEGEGDKASVTVEQLLLHTSGLAPVIGMSALDDDPKVAMRTILASSLRTPPGEKFAYSDLGFITLGRIVERITGEPLDRFAARAVFEPLGMRDSSFGPITGERLARTAPTEAATCERGTVHDPRAAHLGGVAGHAGLFSTGEDVGRFCAMLATGQGPLAESTLRTMTRTRFLPGGYARGLGLDIDSKYSSPRGAEFPRYRSFGHTGFTGPCMWIDGDSGVWYVLMTSRLQVVPAPSMSPLRRVVSDAVAHAMNAARTPGGAPVRTGVDVLAATNCIALEGRRVGLITNITGRTSDGCRTIDVLHESENVELVRLFSPEHGLFAVKEGSVGDAVDEPTGLPVFSLYGDTRKPTAEMLDGLDAVVFDVQDVGVRYYTYPSTLGLAMEACGEAGLTVIVLDRPNPITGERVSGPRTDEDRLSFIGWRPVPLTHGMTVGELALMFKREWGGIDCEVEVVTMDGWERDMWWEETGVPWVNPSPNMRNPTQAVLYPCVGLLEGANLSVGRGTDEPFERFGAPWIDGHALARALTELRLPGIEFTAIEFTPDASKFEEELCGGVHVTVTDRDALRPVEAGMAILWTLNDQYGTKFDAKKGDTRLLSRSTYEALMASPEWCDVPATWKDDVTSFRRQRSPYLLYR